MCDTLIVDCSLQVPGGYQDSLSSNTPLGRAVREACDELEALGSMVRHNMTEQPLYQSNMQKPQSKKSGTCCEHPPVNWRKCEYCSLCNVQEVETIEKANALLAALGYKMPGNPQDSSDA